MKGKICSYCWFCRCELEGLVERFQICSGDTKKWTEVVNNIEYNSSSDGDDDE